MVVVPLSIVAACNSKTFLLSRRSGLSAIFCGVAMWLLIDSLVLVTDSYAVRQTSSYLIIGSRRTTKMFIPPTGACSRLSCCA